MAKTSTRRLEEALEAEENRSLKGEDWAAHPGKVKGAVATWFLNLGSRVYEVRHFSGLGWQAWLKDEPVTEYLPGPIVEVMPKLVLELRVGEVEDVMVPPEKPVDYCRELRGTHLKRYKRHRAMVSKSLAQDFTPVTSKLKGRK